MPSRQKFVREGNMFSTYYLADDGSWVLIDVPTEIVMVDPILLGFGVCAHDEGQIATGTFSNVVLGTPSTGIFDKKADWAGRGDFKAAGGATFADGVYTMSGNGDDIWEQQDEGFFLYTEKAGSWSLSGKVTWVNNDSHDWSKIGVMIREQGDAIDSAHYWIELRGASMGDQVDAQWRPATGEDSANVTIAADGVNVNALDGAGIYLRVSRLAELNKVYTEYSYDGVNWVIAHEQDQEMGEVAAYGLVITNHTDNENVAVATVSDVKLEPTNMTGLGPLWIVGDDAGVWKVADGVLSAFADNGNDPKHAWVNLDMADGNYTVKCDVRMLDWFDDDLPRAGISVRINPDDNGANPGSDRGLNLLFHDDTNSVDILNDLTTWGERVDVAWEVGTWYTMALAADGNNLDAFFTEQGNDVFAAPLTSWSEDRNDLRSPGFPGLTASTYMGLTVEFDNFEVIVGGNVVFSDDFGTFVVEVADWALF